MPRHAVGVIAHPASPAARGRPRRRRRRSCGWCDGAGSPVVLSVNGRRVGEDVDQHRGAVRPALVPRDEQAEEPLPVRVAALRVEEAPGLRVERRRRPARRLEHRQQVLLRHLRPVERARRPALEEQRVDRVIGLARRHEGEARRGPSTSNPSAAARELLAYWRKSAVSGSEARSQQRERRAAWTLTLRNAQAFYRDRVRDFIETRIRPRNKDYKSQLDAGDRWQPIEVIEELKPKAQGGGPVEPVHAARPGAAPCRRELRVRRHPAHQPRICAVRRGDGPDRLGVGSVQLLRARHRQHGGASTATARASRRSSG